MVPASHPGLEANTAIGPTPSKSQVHLKRDFINMHICHISRFGVSDLNMIKSQVIHVHINILAVRNEQGRQF